MKTLSLIICLSLLLAGCTGWTSSRNNNNVLFYKIQHGPHANADAAGRARLRPFFISTTIEENIEEALVNREGTIVAIIWINGTENTGRRQRIKHLFAQNGLEGTQITDKHELNKLVSSLGDNKEWIKDTEVSQLEQ